MLKKFSTCKYNSYKTIIRFKDKQSGPTTF